jgi:hypothetical protein
MTDAAANPVEQTAVNSLERYIGNTIRELRQNMD